MKALNMPAKIVKTNLHNETVDDEVGLIDWRYIAHFTICNWKRPFGRLTKISNYTDIRIYLFTEVFASLFVGCECYSYDACGTSENAFCADTSANIESGGNRYLDIAKYMY